MKFQETIIVSRELIKILMNFYERVFILKNGKKNRQ